MLLKSTNAKFGNGSLGLVEIRANEQFVKIQTTG